MQTITVYRDYHTQKWAINGRVFDSRRDALAEAEKIRRGLAMGTAERVRVKVRCD